MTDLKVLFVGSSPSKKNKVSWVPFVGTRSGKVLESWMQQLGVQGKVMNVYPKVSTNPLNRGEIMFHLDRLSRTAKRFDKIIALGDVAHKALLDADVEHFVLPHPSGLNRKLNDKEYVKDILAKCKIFLGLKQLKYQMIKHKRWRDVAFQVMGVWVGDQVVMQGNYLNQGFDKTYYLLAGDIKVKIDNIGEWLYCLGRADRCIRYSEWRKLDQED